MVVMVRRTRRVELRYRSTKFPDFCPVCDAPVTTDGTIPAFTHSQREEADGLNMWAFTSSRVVGSTRSFPRTEGPSYVTIPVCDRHQFSFQETKHLRGILPLLCGLSIVLAAFLILAVLARILDSGTINTSVAFLLILDLIAIECTYKFGGPTALERSVSVYDMSPDMRTVILDIVNEEYAEELLKLNPMSAMSIDL